MKGVTIMLVIARLPDENNKLCVHYNIGRHTASLWDGNPDTVN